MRHNAQGYIISIHIPIISIQVSNSSIEQHLIRGGDVHNLGEGIAFAGLCLGAAWVEVSGYPSAGLWLLVVLWAFCFGSSRNKGGT